MVLRCFDYAPLRDHIHTQTHRNRKTILSLWAQIGWNAASTTSTKTKGQRKLQMRLKIIFSGSGTSDRADRWRQVRQIKSAKQRLMQRASQQCDIFESSEWTWLCVKEVGYPKNMFDPHFFPIASWGTSPHSWDTKSWGIQFESKSLKRAVAPWPIDWVTILLWDIECCLGLLIPSPYY